MRQGYSERKVKATLVVVFILCFLAFASDASAQGGDGRPENTPRKVPVKRSLKRVARAAPKPAPRIVTPSKPAPPKPGTLAAVINESDSRVYLSSPSKPEPILVSVTTKQRSSYWRMLPPGRYVLTVKKPGFFDEVRAVDIAERGRYRLAINLRPQMAILSLASNIADAEIEIERAGKFRGPLKKHLLKPGKYRIDLRRRGYLTQTVTADLTIPGREQNIYVVLKPLPIDTVLNEANKLLGAGDPDGASLLLKDVLSMNPAHARANLIYGFVELKRANAVSAGYFLKAIIGGETVSIPAKTVFAGELTDVQIAINRDAITFRSAARAELNFRITRSNLEASDRLTAANSLSYVAVRGESDFFGKDIRPNLKVFSKAAVMDISSGLPVCVTRSCAADVEILSNVISGWREMATAGRR